VRFLGGAVPKDNTRSIILLKPAEYFHGAVTGALSTLKISASDYAKNYLINLLSSFIHQEKFYPTDAQGNKVDTLTHQLANALDEASSEGRAVRLRQLGDFSLYVAGFFANSLSRKLVDVDYYIGMGGAAYDTVARLEAEKIKAELFKELAEKFPQFVDVLGQISDESGFNPEDDKALLRIYDLWMKTGSDRLAKQLVKAGIVPGSNKPTDDGQDS
jgi:hypothetical protein